ncbi:hypothetical protein BJ165DRAFT_9229 [Panaeolus papilionaceus]|nr:hypothetical protein BJ165DRAFT_9229 [Panaeolus papilionaceus]
MLDTDGSDIRRKVTQYFINQAHAELEDKNPHLTIGDLPLIQKLPHFRIQPASATGQFVSSTAAVGDVTASQLPPLFPTPPDHGITWKNLLKRDLFSDADVKHPSHLPEGDSDEGAEIPALPSYPPWFRVAIIGAGVAGLRTAMLLQELGIPYDLLEASDRYGGRVFTYKFMPKPPNNPPGKHDYYDVGAMRFPDNKANKITFDLFKELELGTKLIDYTFSNPENIRYFNGVKISAATSNTPGDHFHDQPTVPDQYINAQTVDLRGDTVYGVNACTSMAFDGFRKALLDNFETGWEGLMKYDWASTRTYLFREKPQFPLSVVQWMETRNSSSGGFDGSLSETILESLFFDDPSKNVPWKCIEGGTEGVTKAMYDRLKTKPQYGHRVTDIKGPILLSPKECFPNSGSSDQWHPTAEFPFMKVDISGKGTRYYAHVVSTVPFANLGMINTDDVMMDYAQRQAIRSLSYWPSVKIAIKFKSRWWEQNGQKQRGGSSYTDRPSRVVVYPSYGIGEEGPGVLMVSYTWTQDASRLGSLIKTPDWSQQLNPDRIRPPSEQVLLERIYQDLSILHDVPITQLKDDTLDYHAFDWYSNPYTMGAFAMFNPGQFSTFYKSVLGPAARGRFHFAGEVASAHHAWIAGALDSAVRAVAEIVHLDFPPWLSKYYEKHGISPAFRDEEQATKQFTKGVFGKELEEAELRAYLASQ